MTKRVITGIALAAAICGMALAGCGVGEERDEPGATPVVQQAEALPSGGPIIEVDAYDWIDRSLDKDLASLAKELELPELPEKPDPDRFEFRLWTGLGGLIDSRVLAVRADGREFRADYVVYGWRDGGMKVIEKRKLDEPRSGWNGIAFPFTSRLTTPQGLRRDPYFDLQRDEPIILLEVVQRGEYRRIFYGQSTKFADGVKLKETCEYIAEEFSVDLQCYGGEPWDWR
jgi:hypothetical protein